MTNKETITRNLGLTFDFVNHLIDHPELTEGMPDKFELKFLEQDFSKIIAPAKQKRTKLKERYVKVRNTFEIPNLD